MKKIIIAALVALVGIQAGAQNIQAHYDFRRQCATTTVEMFRPDSFGSTFFFVDMDYAFAAKDPYFDKNQAGCVSGAYWEIAREFNFWQGTKMDWLSVHVEYNGGLSAKANVIDDVPMPGGTVFNNAFLAGLTYSGHNKDFSMTWSLSAMYKAIPGNITLAGNKAPHSFQITGVWGINFARNWCTFSGFADFWKEDRTWQETSFIFISEPQFWVNLNQIKGWEKVGLSVGTEVELSTNFNKKGFDCCPTLALKWTF